MPKSSDNLASKYEWGFPKLWSNSLCHPPWWLLMSWGKARSSHLPLLMLNKETRFGRILECQVNWALESITTNKASGGDGIPVELFQILKDDTVKVLHSICQQIWKAQQWPQDWKRSVFILIPKKGNAKECSDYHTIALISHTSKVMLKILQARLQQHMNRELPDVQAGFRKGRGTRDQIANIRWIMEKAREFQKKHLFLLYWLCQSLGLCGSQ